jgi:hypothetical protein
VVVVVQQVVLAYANTKAMEAQAVVQQVFPVHAVVTIADTVLQVVEELKTLEEQAKLHKLPRPLV